MRVAETPCADAALQDLLAYWLCSSDDWFSHAPEFDRDFRSRFQALHDQARTGALDHWRDSPEGVLGLLILLDQFPRNAFRGTPGMYDTDVEARQVARTALDRDFIDATDASLRVFMLLPFAHSEELADQDLSVELHDRYLPSGSGRARRHRDIVRRFGRFPHRNPILGRDSTVQEQAYLEAGGFRG